MRERPTMVLTISRQLGSGGSFIGQAIANRFGLRYADRVPALFFRVGIDAVRIDQTSLVGEHQCCELKRDPVVFAPVPQVLRFVPFVTHCVYT